MQQEILRLLQSDEAAIRYKTLAMVLDYPPESPEAGQARRAIPSSERVRMLLSERDDTGRIPFHPYFKWRGAHWVLACLADLGYPAGDSSLRPLMEQVYTWLLGKHHTMNIKTIAGRTRRCASQEGNALYASLALGLADERSIELAERLMHWQWPDGGWNCDKRPEAVNASFHESLIPLRALSLYGRQYNDEGARQAAQAAAEIFLKRQLFKRQRDGQTIDTDFISLHYPPYWHYDILFGLKVLAEAGFIHDPRCNPALDLLESKRSPDGGFPAEGKYYHTPRKNVSGGSLVGWGINHKGRANEFVSVDALFVLKSAGRLHLQ
jgi:hypothetical protein